MNETLASERLIRCEHCSKFRWRIFWLVSEEFGALDSWCRRCRPDLYAEFVKDAS